MFRLMDKETFAIKQFIAEHKDTLDHALKAAREQHTKENVEILSDLTRNTGLWIRIDFLISQVKYMLCVLKRTVSLFRLMDKGFFTIKQFITEQKDTLDHALKAAREQHTKEKVAVISDLLRRTSGGTSVGNHNQSSVAAVNAIF